MTDALSVMAFVAIALAAVTVTGRGVRETYTRRQAARAAAVRPMLVALAAGDADPDATAEVAVGDRELERAVGEVLPRVRGQARDRLVEVLQVRGVIDRTVARSRSRSAVRRAAAAETLGVMGVPRTLPVLARLLEDPDREVVRVATRALGRVGDPQAVPFLLDALRSGRGLTPGQVAAAMRHLPGDVADGLCDAIDHADADVRLVAVQVLGMVGTTAAVDRLALALDDPVPAVRAAAAQALGRVGGPRAVAPLARCLRTFDTRLRAAAAAALGRIGDPQAVDVLVAALDDPDLDVVHAASHALAEIGPEGNRALQEPAARHPAAAEALVAALAGIQPRPRAHVSALTLVREVE